MLGFMDTLTLDSVVYNGIKSATIKNYVIDPAWITPGDSIFSFFHCVSCPATFTAVAIKQWGVAITSNKFFNVASRAVSGKAYYLFISLFCPRYDLAALCMGCSYYILGLFVGFIQYIHVN